MASSKEFPSPESAFEHYEQSENSDTVFHGDLVETAAREVRRVCREYDVPVEPTDITVACLTNADVCGSMLPYGCEVSYDEFTETWNADVDPDGYVLLVSEVAFKGSLSFFTGNSPEATVRHEMAHICCFEEYGYTDESTGKHMEWLTRLDAEHTTNN